MSEFVFRAEILITLFLLAVVATVHLGTMEPEPAFVLDDRKCGHPACTDQEKGLCQVPCDGCCGGQCPCKEGPTCGP